jgi:NADH-quinone oxidoreductase subunit J
MTFSNNPIHSVLFLIAIFINVSIIFILFNIDFLGLLILIVYVGAIAILFLFMVMMLNIKKIENEYNTYLLIGLIILLTFLLQIFYLIINFCVIYIPSNLLINVETFFFSDSSNLLDSFNKLLVLKKISVLIFLDYYICLFLSGILLLVALIGAIFLTNNKKGYSMRSQFNSLYKNNNIFNLHIY